MSRVVAAKIGGEDLEFCCYGCVIALQVTRARGDQGEAATILVRLGLAIFFAMNVMMMSLPAYAPHVYGSDSISADGSLFIVLHVLALVFALPVLLLLGVPIFRSALRARSGGFGADTLIVVGVFTAFTLSVARTWQGVGPVYFDTAVMVLVLVTIGRYLEAQAKARAGAAIRRELTPGQSTVVRLTEVGSESVQIDDLRIGDRALVAPGQAFPADGAIAAGKGWVDEAALTGESRPVLKTPGSAVSGGTCSLDGTFELLIQREPRYSATARIARMVTEASREPSPLQRLADRAALVFLPGVVVIALATGFYWTTSSGIDRGILNALSVLVVACPCALGLATPIAIWFGLNEAARRGVIVRSAAALERSGKVDCVLFDKTGTLTQSVPQMTACQPAPGCGLSPDDVLIRTALLERGQSHPLARAIEAAARTRPDVARALDSLDATDVRTVAGGGILGTVLGDSYSAGSREFAAEQIHPNQLPPSQSGDGPCVLLCNGSELLGTLRFAEQIRPTAAELLQRLRTNRCSVGLLSGDRGKNSAVANLMHPSETKFGLSPGQKLREVRAAQQQQRQHGGAVAVVGDGLNDAPALAAADLGVAFGDPTDLTRMSADVVIINDEMLLVEWLLRHARRVQVVVRQNLAWAFAYNALAVGAAAAGQLNPLVASVLMLVSSGVVIANARRLSRDPGQRQIGEPISTWSTTTPSASAVPLEHT